MPALPGTNYVALYAVKDTNDNIVGEYTTDRKAADAVAGRVGGTVWETLAFVYVDRLEVYK